MLDINKIYCGDCIQLMKQLPDDFIDLTVTSPPYDNLRTYKGYQFDFENIAKELFRVTKQGGVIIWVIGDSVVDGSETLTSFKQALYFKDIGFNIHDTMIYGKNAMPFPESNRYNQCFEYMFVLSKGSPAKFNPLKEETVYHKKRTWSSIRRPDGSMERMKYEMGKDERSRFNVWFYNVGYMQSTIDNFAHQHPAMFPEQLAEDHILSWTNEGDLVLDPLCGSGTTCKMAKLNNRNFLGFDISQEYCDIANERVNNYQTIYKWL